MSEASLANKHVCAEGLKRLKTLMCSDSTASMFGCLDRDFWAYRTLRGFPSAPYQHAMSGFAYLARCSDTHESQHLSTLSLVSLDYWLNHRNKNGSANEWYRNEQSYCATAMGLQSAAEALWVLQSDEMLDEIQTRGHRLVKSAQWLESRHNSLATNQEIASLSGRYVLGAMLSNQKMRESAVRSLHQVQTTFDRNGFLPEYGGMDVGYTLLSIDLLIIAHRAGMAECEPLVSDLCQQLTMIAGPTGELPFSLGSRGTSHRFYGGVEYFSQHIESASVLQERVVASRPTAQAEHVMQYDDRYLATFAFSALARRHHVEQRRVVGFDGRKHQMRAVLPPPIRVVADDDGSTATNSHFGHGLCWNSNSGNRVEHLGYVFTDESGHRWTSLVQPEGDIGEHHFTRVSDALPLRESELRYRLVFWLCRIPLVARTVSWWARARTGRPRKTRAMWLHREITYSEPAVVIRDRIRFSGPTVGKINVISSFPYHSPSSLSPVLAGLEEHLFEREICQVSGTGEAVIDWKINSQPQRSGIVDVL